MDAAAGAQGGVEHAGQRALGVTALAGRAERRANLPEDLTLTDDHGLQAAGDAEQVGDAIGFPKLVDMSLQLGARHAGISNHEVADAAHQPDVVGVVDVNLGAIAGG